MRFWPENAFGVFPQVVQASGTSTIVVGVPNRSIRVINVFLTVSANCTLQWQSHALPTNITGASPITATGGYVLPSDYFGWFQTLPGESLDLVVTGGATAAGVLSYNLVGP